MGVAGIAAPGIDPESTYSLGQCRLLGAGGGQERCSGFKISFSVTCTPVKTVWLCVSWTLIFLSLCLLIASDYSLSPLACKLSLWLNLKKPTRIVLGAMPSQVLKDNL